MITKSRIGIFLMLIFAVMLYMPTEVFATAVDLKSQAKHISTQIVSVPKIIAVASYVIGVFMAVQALLALQRYTENPAENPITRIIGFASVSALLISLPYIIHLTRNTLSANTEFVKSSSGHFTSNF